MRFSGLGCRCCCPNIHLYVSADGCCPPGRHPLVGTYHVTGPNGFDQTWDVTTGGASWPIDLAAYGEGDYTVTIDCANFEVYTTTVHVACGATFVSPTLVPLAGFVCTGGCNHPYPDTMLAECKYGTASLTWYPDAGGNGGTYFGCLMATDLVTITDAYGYPCNATTSGEFPLLIFYPLPCIAPLGFRPAVGHVQGCCDPATGGSASLGGRPHQGQSCPDGYPTLDECFMSYHFHPEQGLDTDYPPTGGGCLIDPPYMTPAIWTFNGIAGVRFALAGNPYFRNGDTITFYFP